MSDHPADHQPYTDDGVTYCGWRGDAKVFSGCGELWPCSTIRAATAPSTEAVGEVRRRSENRQLTELVGVRLLPEEHERALVLADRADLTVASLLRGLLRDRIEEIGETESEQERRRLIGDDWTTNVELEQAVAEVKRARGVESMQAYELAKLLPEHLRKPFWEEAVEYYLADALALTEAVERDGCWVPLAEANQLRSDLAAMTSERDAARADLLAYADAAAIADDDHTCEVCEVATELAEERTLHQQTIAERDRWKSRASKEHVQELTLERDEARAEAEQLRYERRLLGFARRTLDLVVAGPQASDDWDRARREAADIAQRIVDEIGHPATDEDALGPSFRRQIDAIRPVVEAAKAWREIDRYGGLSSNRTLANAVDVYTNQEASE